MTSIGLRDENESSSQAGSTAFVIGMEVQRENLLSRPDGMWPEKIRVFRPLPLACRLTHEQAMILSTFGPQRLM